MDKKKEAEKKRAKDNLQEACEEYLYYFGRDGFLDFIFAFIKAIVN